MTGVHAPAVPVTLPTSRVIGGWLWTLIPLVSFGVLAWVPLLHSWLRLRKPSLLTWSIALGGAIVLCFILLDAAPDGPDAGGPALAIGSILFFSVPVAGFIKALLLRPKVFGHRRSDLPVATTTWTSMSAVAQVEHARARRAEARTIVESDPAMARELRIGRPDLPGRTYDDGGLVDLNHVPADAMVHLLELSPAFADEVCRAREELHGFSALGELSAYTSVPAPVVDGLGERAVFLRY